MRVYTRFFDWDKPMEFEAIFYDETFGVFLQPLEGGNTLLRLDSQYVAFSPNAFKKDGVAKHAERVKRSLAKTLPPPESIDLVVEVPSIQDWERVVNKK